MNKFRKWNPIEFDIPLNVEVIHDDYEGFRILMKGNEVDSKMLKIAFENPLMYQNINESYKLKIWEGLSKEISGNIFYKIDDSELVDSFNENSLNAYSNWDIIHFAFYTYQDCIDVLSITDPIIEWLN